jgi:hypothetical protein
MDYTFIMAYAPVNPSSDAENLPGGLVYRFWETLTEWILDTPKRSILVLSMDGNAHMGKDGNGKLTWDTCPLIGTHFPEVNNNNGHHFIKLCTRAGLSPINTFANSV